VLGEVQIDVEKLSSIAFELVLCRVCSSSH
jgi:hypothetical protein